MASSQSSNVSTTLLVFLALLVIQGLAQGNCPFRCDTYALKYNLADNTCGVDPNNKSGVRFDVAFCPCGESSINFEARLVLQNGQVTTLTTQQPIPTTNADAPIINTFTFPQLWADLGTGPRATLLVAKSRPNAAPTGSLVVTFRQSPYASNTFSTSTTTTTTYSTTRTSTNVSTDSSTTTTTVTDTSTITSPCATGTTTATASPGITQTVTSTVTPYARTTTKTTCKTKTTTVSCTTKYRQARATQLLRRQNNGEVYDPPYNPPQFEEPFCNPKDGTSPAGTVYSTTSTTTATVEFTTTTVSSTTTTTLTSTSSTQTTITECSTVIATNTVTPTTTTTKTTTKPRVTVTKTRTTTSTVTKFYGGKPRTCPTRYGGYRE